MSAAKILAILSSLFGCLQGEYWKHPHFETFKKHVETLASSLAQYSDYLVSKNKRMKEVHNAEVPVRQLSESLSIEVVKRSAIRYPCFSSLSECLNDIQPYQQIFLTDHCPEAPRLRYECRQKIQRGLNIPVEILTFSPGNNRGNLHFIWKYCSDDSMEMVFQKSMAVVESIKPQLPTCHTRAMRKYLFSQFGRISPHVKPSVLRYFYRDLTGDSSASTNLTEEKIDSRICQVLDMELEDPQTLIDLRSLNSSTQRAKYDVFWDNCSQYLREVVGTAVDDHRHSEVVHLAQAISFRDLREQVKYAVQKALQYRQLNGSDFSFLQKQNIPRWHHSTLVGHKSLPYLIIIC